MNETTAQVRELTVELPLSAPLVRVTAGYGSAGQKTWNLRRPVTLIGSRRPAHIVLHDHDISSAHCVVVNTGTEVLLKDLHTSSGTYVNKTRVDLTILQDGDVIGIGNTSIQVAVHVPEDVSGDSGCGLEFVDPAKFPRPLTVRLLHTDRQWVVQDAVVLIGRHGSAPLRLDHEDVSSRHAVLFRFRTAAALFDLGSRTGLLVNGQRCSLTPLQDADRVTIGPFGLGLSVGDGFGTQLLPVATLAENPLAPSAGEAAGGPAGSAARTGSSGSATAGSPSFPSSADQAGLSGSPSHPGGGRGGFASDGDPLVTDILDTWQTLNARLGPRAGDGTAAGRAQGDLTAREAEFEARDAALRGQLHDVTRFHEQVLARERELAAQVALIQADRDTLAAAQKACADREAGLAKLDEELHRREHVLAQRWSRLQTVICSHCGKPVTLGQVGPAEASTQPH